MNIFEALSCGKGCINEENVSSFLGYLLNPIEDHGLKDVFLKKFIGILNKKNQDNNNKDNLSQEASELHNLKNIDIKYELPVNITEEKSQKKRIRRIDIVVEIADKKIIAIENKINKCAIVDENQLIDEYIGLRSYEDYKEKETIHFVFLTPKLSDCLAYKKLKERLNNLNDCCYWIYWEDIFEVLRKILQMESVGSLSPIDENVKVAIKSFINFIERQKGITFKDEAGNLYEIIIGNGTTKFPLRYYDSEAQDWTDVLPHKKSPHSVMLNQVELLEKQGKIEKKEHDTNNNTLAPILIKYYSKDY